MTALTHAELIHWLRETDDSRLDTLWRMADETRRTHVGDAVHLRGLIEFSSHCARACAYCGLRAPNSAVVRYRMTSDEIVECAHQAVAFGYGAVVLQSGEDRGFTAAALADIVRRIKDETPLAVTLSVGERDNAELALWRAAGADRYLLRFETSNSALYRAIHPDLPGRPSDRVAQLMRLRALGYEIGSGAMIGIPGQTWDDLARDLFLFAELELDMIGVGPYLPHPDTPLAAITPLHAINPQQVPNSEEMTYKALALARLTRPTANIPATTALATLNKRYGRELGLRRGANVVMPNLTPPRYREQYQIYPDKACLTESAADCHGCMRWRIESIGRTVGVGRGDSPSQLARQTASPDPQKGPLSACP